MATTFLRDAARFALGFAPFGWPRIDGEYHAWSRLLRSTEAMRTEEIRDLQFQVLRAIVDKAYRESPFYRSFYDQHGFQPSKLKDLGDVSRIPILTKRHVREHQQAMLTSRERGARYGECTTSGTTGTPMRIVTPPGQTMREWASICYQWAQAGYRVEDGRIELRGRVPGDALWHFDRYRRVLRLNINRLNEANLPSVLSCLERSSYRFYHCYPSAIAHFCRLLEATGRASQVRPPTAILLASEVVYDAQIAIIRRVLPESRIVAHYGMAEQAALAAWPPESSCYAFLPLYGYVEVDPLTHELIATSLMNVAMPLIRYATTDLCRGFQAEPQKSRPHLFPIVADVEGRLGDNLRKANGDFVSTTSLTFPFKTGTTFTAVKLIQHRLDLIEILAETSRPAAEVKREFEDVKAKLRAIFGPGTTFSLTLTRSIERGATGKFRWIENRMESARSAR